MSDNKVSVKEALEKLYDLSWMIGSISVVTFMFSRRPFMKL